jgi:hypothetical protein
MGAELDNLRHKFTIAIKILRKEKLGDIADYLAEKAEELGLYRCQVRKHDSHNDVLLMNVGRSPLAGLYEDVVKCNPPKGLFVEIGSENPRDFSTLVWEIIRSGKDIVVDCVTPQCLSSEYDKHKNIEGIEKYTRFLAVDPMTAAEQYNDNSVDFVMFATSDVTQEMLEVWKRKLKYGGWMAGVGYDELTTKSVVDALFQDIIIRQDQPIWTYKKYHKPSDVKVTTVITSVNIDSKRIHDYFKWNNDLFVRQQMDVVLVIDKPLEDLDYPYLTQIPYPMDESGVYSLSRGGNYGVKRVSTPGVVFKSDIDMVYTDDMVSYLRNTVRNGVGCTCLTQYVSSYEMVAKYGTMDYNYNVLHGAFGGCIAFTSADWERLKGFNENLYGWGGEDGELIARAKRTVEIVTIDWIPLFHIEHETRTQTQQFPNRIEANRKKAMEGWNPEVWGE